jgi:3-carboxy-cis,cis-muconate cycloisomerase
MSVPPPRLLDALFTTTAMAGVLSDRARLQAMLDFEAALARAEGVCGVIPARAAAVIATTCHVERLDVAALGAALGAAGNPALPLIAGLTAAVAAQDPEAAGWVHWGATSQDVIDTGAVLQLRTALDLIGNDLDRLCETLRAQIRAHRHTVMCGRTLLQHAVPITLGLKLAGTLDALHRARTRLRETRERALVVQFGGAAGTLAALGGQGAAVIRHLAAELGLATAALPWHAQRDRVAETGTTLALLVGSLAKLARDVALLMQSEVAEAGETLAGTSSTMPHKRNPIACPLVIAAATRLPGLAATLLAALPQEHERGLGGWHAEWETLPEICRLTAGALAQMHTVVEGLEIDAARMRATLVAAPGLAAAESLAFALAAHLGRPAAHELVARLAREAQSTGRTLEQLAAAIPEVAGRLSRAELAAACDPAQQLGAAQEFIDQVLDAT